MYYYVIHKDGKINNPISVFFMVYKPCKSTTRPSKAPTKARITLVPQIIVVGPECVNTSHCPLQLSRLPQAPTPTRNPSPALAA